MSVNRVILIGNVGQDPRVKYFDTGSAVATFPLATTDRGYTLQNGTQIPERTEWHNIVASNRLAEIVDKYVHKGDKLYLEGKIRTRSYSDQSGAMRYITEIYVDNMEMLSPKGANTGAGAPQPSATQAQQPQQPVLPPNPPPRWKMARFAPATSLWTPTATASSAATSCASACFRPWSRATSRRLRSASITWPSTCDARTEVR